MHAYCTAARLTAGLLIYGEGTIGLHRHHITSTSAVISVMAVDLSGTPEAIQASVGTIAAEARHLTASRNHAEPSTL